MSPTYQGLGVGMVVSAAERFDLEAWLNTPGALAVDRRDALLAIMARELKLASEIDDETGRADDAEIREEGLTLRLETVERARAVLDLQYGNLHAHYGDLVDALQKALSTVQPLISLEPVIRDHSSVLEEFRPVDPSSPQEQKA